MTPGLLRFVISVDAALQVRFTCAATGAEGPAWRVQVRQDGAADRSGQVGRPGRVRR
jgi:hypothetical protein